MNRYVQQLLMNPTYQDNDFKAIIKEPYQRKEGDPKIIAYYLSQMHPTPENDAWWGKGVTEWNNVSRAVPQFVNHYQPRLPGELGFYDLRLKENLVRQMELAKMYGLYAFNWYYYWFDGKRLLEHYEEVLGWIIDDYRRNVEKMIASKCEALEAALG